METDSDFFCVWLSFLWLFCSYCCCRCVFSVNDCMRLSWTWLFLCLPLPLCFLISLSPIFRCFNSKIPVSYTFCYVYVGACCINNTSCVDVVVFPFANRRKSFKIRFAKSYSHRHWHTHIHILAHSDFGCSYMHNLDINAQIRFVPAILFCLFVVRPLVMLDVFEIRRGITAVIPSLYLLHAVHIVDQMAFEPSNKIRIWHVHFCWNAWREHEQNYFMHFYRLFLWTVQFHLKRCKLKENCKNFLFERILFRRGKCTPTEFIHNLLWDAHTQEYSRSNIIAICDALYRHIISYDGKHSLNVFGKMIV